MCLPGNLCKRIGTYLLIVGLISGPGPTVASSPTSPPPPHLGYGINVRLEGNIDPLFTPLGLDWIKLWEEYQPSPPSRRLPAQVLFTLHCNGMPANLNAWGARVSQIARAGRGFVEAYEVCNEPNLDRFWGGAPPNPAQYVQMLRVAHERIKAVDPAAIIVSAGLAPTGRIKGNCRGWSGNDCHAMDEREYTRQMLLLGAGEYFDAFGYHPYGFAYEPERALSELPPHDNGNGFAFRGVEAIRALLEQHGLADKPIWATEFNWLRDDGGTLPADCRSAYEATFGWMEVSADQQADYLVRAFRYADEHWPWMGAMFVWNLDWHNYHTWDCEAARYFSLRRHNGTTYGAPTPAYNALAALEKRPGHFGPILAVDPPGLTLLTDVLQPGPVTATLTIRNAGYRLLHWTATVVTGMELTPTLAITTGLQGEPLTITVDTTGYPVGTFTGGVTIAAAPTDTLNSPYIVPITLTVAHLHPRLAVIPPSLSFLAGASEPRTLTGVVVPTNTGHHVLTWTARVLTGMQISGTGSLGVQITPTLALTTGLQGTPLTVTLDTTGYAPGTFIGLISVEAIPTHTLDSPQIVPVILRVAEQLHRLYLPLILRSFPSTVQR
ncbi:MAG: hypothetical protein N2508_10340 [Anaerolineae bacterium]|nr:hypothetical protein [Anaerolineae bacterium]